MGVLEEVERFFTAKAEEGESLAVEADGEMPGYPEGALVCD